MAARNRWDTGQLGKQGDSFPQGTPTAIAKAKCQDSLYKGDLRTTMGCLNWPFGV
jgi:hypothetical protein